MDWLRKQLAPVQDGTAWKEGAAGKVLGFSQQATSQLVSLAEKASSQVKAITASATQEVERKLHGLREGRQTPPEHLPHEHGVTPELCEYLQGLTYSTWIDYPTDSLAAMGGGNALLTPWQEAHVKMVLEKSKHIENLRFILVPRKMEDPCFWSIYFKLIEGFVPLPMGDSSSTLRPAREVPAGSTAHVESPELEDDEFLGLQGSSETSGGHHDDANQESDKGSDLEGLEEYLQQLDEEVVEGEGDHEQHEQQDGGS